MVTTAAVFLFAHQDDEFGIFQHIREEIRLGRNVFCAYLTDGGSQSQRRNKESLLVLRKLGVSEKNIFFIGSDLEIPDGRLPEYLDKAASWLRSWLQEFMPLQTIYIPAWEGGHQDHDALHVIALKIAEEVGAHNCLRQFSLYNADGCAWLFFRVFNPLTANGPVQTRKIPWVDRFEFLSFCLSYPSQWSAWLGLFPFVVLHYLSSGVQMLQFVVPDRIREKPHGGALYYEKRNFYRWEDFRDRISVFLSHSNDEIGDHKKNKNID